MSETETAAPEAPEAPSAPEEPKPDPIALLEAKVEATRKELEETKLAARRTQGESSSHARRLEKRMGELQATIADLATRGMSPEEARAYRAEAALREAETRTQERSDYAQQASAFEQEAASILAAKGINSADPRLTESYRRYASEHNTPEGWRLALGLAIADIEADERRKVDEERQKLLADAQVRERNAQRREQGPVDRGVPAGGGGKRPAEMNDQEFQQHLDRLNAEARRKRGF